MSYYKSLVERVLTPTDISGDEYIYPCPKCENVNTGHHLYVNYSKDKFHCVKCGYGGKSISYLVKELGLKLDYDYEGMLSTTSSELDDVINLSSTPKSKRTVDYSKNLDTLTTYYNIHTKELSLDARNYLYSRGLTDYWIDLFGIREGLNNYGFKYNINNKEYSGRDYSGRVLVPSINKNNKISFYVARDYTSLKKVKYLNPPKELAYASEDVWNLDIINSKDVVICEGVFSSIAVNIACNSLVSVATYGKSISDKSNSDSDLFNITSQGEKLLSKKFNTYYVFYDKDAKVEAFKTMEYLYNRGAYVKYVEILTNDYGPKADASDMTCEEIKHYLNISKVYNRFIPYDL